MISQIRRTRKGYPHTIVEAAGARGGKGETVSLFKRPILTGRNGARQVQALNDQVQARNGQMEALNHICQPGGIIPNLVVEVRTINRSMTITIKG